MAAPVVQAIVARELGERFAQKELLGEALRDGVQAVMLRAQMVRHGRRISRVRDHGRALLLRLPARIPAADRVRSRSVTELPARNRAHAEALLRRAQLWADLTREPLHRVRLLIAVSRLLRTLGRHAEAQAVCENALQFARRPERPLATEAARAAFEEVESLRVLGRFEEALELVRLRLHSLGMSHWGPWMEYEQGCVHLQLREFTTARYYVDRAAAFFFSIDPSDPATAYDPMPGRRFVRLARIGLVRCDRPDEGALQSLLGELGHGELQGGSPVLRGNVAFQLAEVARARKHWSQARKNYQEMEACVENYGTLSLLGQVFCAWGEGDLEAASTLLAEAMEMAAAQQSIFGLAYGLMLETVLELPPHPVAPEQKERAEQLGERWSHSPDGERVRNLDPSFQLAFV